MGFSPQPFPPLPNVAVASYDYTDIAEGTGIQVLYAQVGDNTAARFYTLTSSTDCSTALTNSTTSSGLDSWKSAMTETSDTTQFDLDFDLAPFNTPKEIKGRVYYQIPFYTGGNNSSDRFTVYFKVYVRKWDGSTETQIANGTSGTFVSNAQNMGGTVNGYVTISTKTHFNSGEQLRITVEAHQWFSAKTSADGTFGFAHNPANTYTPFVYTSATAGAAGKSVMSSQTIFKVPFVLDI